MNARLRSRREREKEITRNVLLIILAIGVVVIFFNLDVLKRVGSEFTNSADKRLLFRGELGKRQFSDKEIDRLVAFIERNKDQVEQMTVETSVQRGYREITGDTRVTFEVHLTLKNDVEFSTTARRERRDHLTSGILAKLDKDMRAYRELLRKGIKVKSFINTM